MNNTVRILHTADLHLGAQLSTVGAKAAERRAELILSAEKIFGLCREYKIQLMLISGDVFENNSVDSETVKRIFSLISRVPETQVVFAAGNHDPLTADSPFLGADLPENLTVLGTEASAVKLPALPVTVYGKSFGSVYMKSEPYFALIPDDDTINIMVMHGDFGTNTGGQYNTITEEFLRHSKMDYAALGHIHNFSGIKKAGETYFAYPGCPEPHGFDEPGEKGVLIGEIGKNECNLRFIPTCIRRNETVKIDISGCENPADTSDVILKFLAENYPETYRKNLYKIILCGQLRENTVPDLTEITRRLQEHLYFIKLRDRTEPMVDINALSHENSLKGKFVKEILKRIEEQPEQKSVLEKALVLGLRAFSSEVKLNEN